MCGQKPQLDTKSNNKTAQLHNKRGQQYKNKRNKQTTKPPTNGTRDNSGQKSGEFKQTQTQA